MNGDGVSNVILLTAGMVQLEQQQQLYSCYACAWPTCVLCHYKGTGSCGIISSLDSVRFIDYSLVTTASAKLFNALRCRG